MENARSAELKAIESENKSKKITFLGISLPFEPSEYEKERMTDNTLELYKLAGKKYINEKNYVSAIRCYNKCYDIYKTNNKVHDMIEMIKTIIDNCMDDFSTDEKIAYRKKIIELYSLSDRQSSISNKNKQLFEIISLLESEYRYAEALTYANLFDNNTYEKMKNYEKKKDLYIRLEQYENATKEYIKMAECQIKNHGYSFAVRNIMMAIICSTIVSTSYGKELNDKYSYDELDMKKDYLCSSEGTFTSQIIEAVENYDQNKFETACANYERMIKLNALQVKLLLIIKQRITGNGSLTNSDQININESDIIDEPDFR